MKTYLLKDDMQYLGNKFNCTKELTSWVSTFVDEPTLESIATEKFLTNMITQYGEYVTPCVLPLDYKAHDLLTVFIDSLTIKFNNKKIIKKYVDVLISVRKYGTYPLEQLSEALDCLYKIVLITLLDEKFTTTSKENIIAFYKVTILPLFNPQSNQIIYSLVNYGVYPLTVMSSAESINYNSHLNVEAVDYLKVSTEKEPYLPTHSRAYLITEFLLNHELLETPPPYLARTPNLNNLDTSTLLDGLNHSNLKNGVKVKTLVEENLDYLEDLYYSVVNSKFETVNSDELEYNSPYLHTKWLNNLFDTKTLVPFYKKCCEYLLLTSNSCEEPIKQEYKNIFDLFKELNLDLLPIFKMAIQLSLNARGDYFKGKISPLLTDFSLTSLQELLRNSYIKMNYTTIMTYVNTITLANLVTTLQFVDDLQLDYETTLEIIQGYSNNYLESIGITVKSKIPIKIPIAQLIEIDPTTSLATLLTHITGEYFYSKLLYDLYIKISQ